MNKNHTFEIDFSNLPKTNKGFVSWVETEGLTVNFMHNSKVDFFRIIEYNKTNQKLSILYNDEVINITTDSVNKNNLSKLFKVVTREFKIKIGHCFKDKNRDLIIIDREYRNREDNKGNNKFYKYYCNKCGYEGWKVESCLITQNIGCSCCANRVIVEGINDIPTTAPEMVRYFQGGYDEAKLYAKGSSKKIYPICPDCGKVRDKLIMINTIYRNKTISCGCSDGFSYGHKYMVSMLNQLNVIFKQNNMPEWCKFLRYKDKNVFTKGEYDFIIEDLKLIIEIDGGFHRKLNTLSGQTQEKSEYIDSKKDELAKDNGYKIIRIYYDDNNMSIKKYILTSKLKDIFYLDSVDWEECESFSLKNIIKDVSLYACNHPNLMTSEIASNFNLERTTVIKYLKKGTKAGWCNYDGKTEMRKSQRNTISLRRVPIEIFKNGETLGEFHSLQDICSQSKKLYGVKFNSNSISDRVNINKNTYNTEYKGYFFRKVVQHEK